MTCSASKNRMTIELWFAFLVSSAILLVIPGPTILTVISYSISQGRAAGLALVLAVALGDATALGLSLVGLGTLLAKSAFWFQVIKWMGGLYLIYLGLQMIRQATAKQSMPMESVPAETGKMFLNTYLVTALNPKGIVFFIAFLPLFVEPDHNVGMQFWVLSVTFVVLAVVNTSLYVFFSDKARSFLSSPARQQKFKFSGGGLLTFAGLWAVTSD